MMSQEQVEQFKDQGFAVVRDVLTAPVVQAVIAEATRFQQMVADWEYSQGDFNLEAPGGGFLGMKGGVKSYKGLLRIVQNATHHSDYLRDLSESSQIKDVFEPLLGKRIQLTNAIVWYKPARVGSEKPWHQDFAYLPGEVPNEVNLWVALDDATKENGCLQFIRGSHRLGLIGHIGEELQLDEPMFDMNTREYVELKSGSGVIFHSLTIHGSSPNTSAKERRVLMLRYKPLVGEE